MTRAATNAGRAASGRHSDTSGRRSESGFALLVIFLIAAAVAFTMYQEMPRAAFESARDKEQLLMDRGNQYKRAIQVFYAENKRYPSEIKDLESTNQKRYLRRRYIDPMTGQDEWRLIHTNGSFLTDSLVQKPPAQNAANGLPGQGQTPGGGPLGTNNMNSSPASAGANSASGAFSLGTGASTSTSTTTSTDPSAAAVPAPLNAAAQRRPSDRGFPTGPGFPQPPGANAGNPNMAGANAAAFDPSDPRTWPPITIATPTSQPGQAQQPGIGQNPQAANSPPFGAAQPGAAGQQYPAQPQTNMGQLNGMGGANPQPSSPFSANPLGGSGLSSAPVQNTGGQNQAQASVNQVSINQDGQLTPQTNQPPPFPQPQPSVGAATPPAVPQPSNASQAANLVANAAANLTNGGFNPQAAPQIQSAGIGAANGLGNTSINNTPGNAPGSPTGNGAIDAINSGLFRPNQAPASGPTGSPGIAGVASTFKGPSIKAYHERTKYQEWEFVYEPTTGQPGTGQPAANPAGANPAGLAGAAGMGLSPGPNSGQNSGVNPSQSPGQTTGGAAPANPFSQPNPFTQSNPFTPQSPTQ